MRKTLLILCATFSTALPAQQAYKGYPSRSGEINIRQHFANPPKGYGNVPFYWWNGDSLNRNRLEEQMVELHNASTDGFAVSYIHTHPKVDVAVNANGYGGFGKPDAGAPGFFTKEWWDTWNWFSGKCAEKGIGLGVDDYVVGWAGNGYYVDELLANKSFSSYQGRLKSKCYKVEPGATLKLELPSHLVSVVAYPDNINLTDKVVENKLTWKSTSSQEQKVYTIYSEASYELHPQYGKWLVEAYFNRFEDKLDEQGRKGLNYFFQDELHYVLNIHSWCEDMPEEFKKRKGYDVLPYLPALFEQIGNITPKIRLDYAEVVTQLSEERYFKPVFDWHNKRGLIYGCDNSGRGLEPLEYLDYFRATSWFTAPGNDAPARGSSFRQTKVSSSVTHLYQRPRTWLEAFHSMGWDSNGEWLTSQLDHHIIAGGNLLCLHGLYYSTHGGWWEWAPPCFHFRMPYWPHMKRWLKYAERLNFLLSQGVHVCDIAVMYPTESMQAYPGTNADTMWNLTDMLSATGLDYDYLDFQSLQKADVKNGELSIADEKYKVLILADIKAMHHETLLKILDFYRKGGIVIATGALPKATSKAGENDAETETILQEIFSDKGKGIIEKDYKKIPDVITQHITPDFQSSVNEGKVLHRKIAQQDVYMIMNVKKDAEVFFRTKGKVECWDAKNGSIKEQPVLRQTKDGTWIKYNGEYTESRVLVFTPGVPAYESPVSNKMEVKQIQPVTGNWQVDIIPTMNNKWGDFRLPATDELIGVEAREFSYTFLPATDKLHATPVFSTDVLKGVYGYAPYMTTITLDSSVDLKSYLQQEVKTDNWKPYCYSWQYGVFDNPGGQGYHGLKGKVENRFIILDQGGHQLFNTSVYAPKRGHYRIEQEGTVPDFLYIDGKVITGKTVSLDKGWHKLLLVYANTAKGSYVLSEKKSYSVDERNRSAVVFYEENAPTPKINSPYDHLIAMKWYATEHLPYSIKADQKGCWAYTFETAPGTKSFTFQVKGELKQLWVDAKEVKVKDLIAGAEKGIYTCNVKEHKPGINTVIITAMPDKDYSGPAFFVEPVKITCEQGEMPVGNWADFGALRFYSGGIQYSKDIEIPAAMLGRKLELDLGMVDATCEVKVNGQSVDVLMNPPYKLDITKYVKTGNNKVEVLVYSTLSNHYQTIPSAYRGEPRAGILGPVKLIGSF